MTWLGSLFASSQPSQEDRLRERALLAQAEETRRWERLSYVPQELIEAHRARRRAEPRPAPVLLRRAK